MAESDVELGSPALHQTLEEALNESPSSSSSSVAVEEKRFPVCLRSTAVRALVVVGVLAVLLVFAFLWAMFSSSRVSWDSPVARPLLTGRLKNNVSYEVLFLRQTTSASASCAVNLLVPAGSNQEEEGFTGMAHLLEHMAFDQAGKWIGPRNALFAAFLGQGVGFNAFTFFDRTVYQTWNLVGEKRLDTMFQMHVAQVSQLNLTEASVAVEKGAVLGEARYRNSSGINKEIYTHHLGPLERWTIGSHDDLMERSTAAGLQRYYQRNYRVDRMKVQVVCSDNPGSFLLPLITSRFETMQSPAKMDYVTKATVTGGGSGAAVLKVHSYSINGVEMNLMLSEKIDAAPVTTYRRVFDMQCAALFDVMFHLKAPALYNNLIGTTTWEQSSRFIYSGFGFSSGPDHTDVVDELVAFGIVALRKLAYDPYDLALVQTLFEKLTEQAEQSLPSPASVASSMAHGKIFALPGDRLPADPSTLKLAVAKMRQFALNLLSAWENAVLKNACDFNSTRCTMTLFTAPRSGLTPDQVLAKMQVVFRSIPDHQTRFVPELHGVPDNLSSLLEAKRKLLHMRGSDFPPVRRRSEQEPVRAAVDAPSSLSKTPISRFSLGRMSAGAAIFVEGATPHWRVYAKNRWGPHLCRFLTQVQAFDWYYESKGVPYDGVLGPVPSIWCRGRKISLEFIGSSVTAKWLSATLMPLVSNELVERVRHAEAERDLSARTLGEFDTFWKKTVNATTEALVWGQSNTLIDTTGDHDGFPSASELQRQIWQAFSPDQIQMVYVGPRANFNATEWSKSFDHVVEQDNTTGTSTAAALSTGADLIRLSVSQPFSNWNKSAVVFAAEFARVDLHPELLEAVLYWKLFRTIRTLGGFSYFASYSKLLILDDKMIMTANWLVGGDFPVNQDNSAKSADMLRRALQSPLSLENDWKAPVDGYLADLPRRSRTYTFLLDAAYHFLYNGVDIREFSSSSPAKLDAFLLSGNKSVAVSLDADFNSDDGIIRFH